MTSMTHSIAAGWRSLRRQVAQPLAWLALARGYEAEGLAWQAHYAARQAIRLDGGILPQAQEVLRFASDWPGDAEVLLGRSLLLEAGSLAERVHAGLQRCPDDWLGWLYLARLLDYGAVAVLPSAEEALGEALRNEVVPGETLHWLGLWRLRAGDANGAVAALGPLAALEPVRHGSMSFLGEALLRLGRVAEAEQCFSQASLSENPDFLLGLANRVYALNYWQEATAVLKKAHRIAPRDPAILRRLAAILSEVYALDDCRKTLEALLALAPEDADGRQLLAGLQGRGGDAAGHMRLLQTAYRESGDPLSPLASSIAMVSLYQDDMSAQAVADLHRSLAAPIEAATPRRLEFGNSRVKGRRLRIGYVTGDLHRQHPVNIFMLPALLHHDHTRFDIRVYYTGTMHDEYTRRAREAADGWLEAAGWDDSALRDAIVADGVDVLVDLAGHTSSHRLGVFALGAAPVQATFLGYPHSTGLSCIDWLIGDGIVSPPEHAHLYSEGLALLPDSVFCWAPVGDYPLPPPRPANAPLVFGSFNNAMKLSPRAVALWAKVLKAVPGSRLLLKAPSLRDMSVQARFAGMFAAWGIGLERIEMRGPTGLADMMQEYGDVDIALDPTPYNGGTTTLQALWMGVPVVTLTGENFVGRMGTSFVHALGFPEWAAESEADFVDKAVALAEDSGLRAGRAALRAQMAASPLCNIDAYARHFESLLARMWQCHESGEGAANLCLQMERAG